MSTPRSTLQPLVIEEHHGLHCDRRGGRVWPDVNRAASPPAGVRSRRRAGTAAAPAAVGRHPDAGEGQPDQRLAEQPGELGVHERHPRRAEPERVGRQVQAALDQAGVELGLADEYAQNDRLGTRPSATVATPPSPSYVVAVRAAWTTTRASRPPRRARGGRAARPAPRVSEPRIAPWTCSSTPPRMPYCSSRVASSRPSIAPTTDRCVRRRPGSAFASSRADAIVSTSAVLDGHQIPPRRDPGLPRTRGSFAEVAIRSAGVFDSSGRLPSNRMRRH